MKKIFLFLAVTFSTASYSQLTNANIHQAVIDWIENPTTAEATYGHISDWDVSNVTNMKGIFYGSSFFNQDLTKWCVKNIITEPENFCKYSSIIEANKPKWGTCPSD